MLKKDNCWTGGKTWKEMRSQMLFCSYCRRLLPFLFAAAFCDARPVILMIVTTCVYPADLDFTDCNLYSGAN